MMMKSRTYLSAAALLVLSLLIGCGESSLTDGLASQPPQVVSSSPLDGTTTAALNGTVSAVFSENMDPATLTPATFTVTIGESAVPVTGRVICSERAVTFLPFAPFAPFASNATFSAKITTGATSASGLALPQDYAWTFATSSSSEGTPTVILTEPLDEGMGVAPNSSVSATFSENMDPATLTDTTFKVTCGELAIPVEGTVIYSDRTAVFWPSVHLASDSTFTATITTGAASAVAVQLADDYVWTFTTGSTNDPGLPVNLGRAGDYVILAKSGVSMVPISAVTGDIGVSPVAATYMTGFSLTMDATNEFSTSPYVTGRLYAANYAEPTPTDLTATVGDMMIAYTDAAGRAPDVTELGAGDIGGMTLTPGVYKWSSGLLIPTDLTLTGSPTDVWIFQIAQDLTISSGTQVVLAGGAMAKNVFWQVAGSVDIGTTAHVEGVVLGQTAITLRTGATINGRLLAQTAVTVDNSTVVQPATDPTGIFGPTEILSQ